MSEIVPADQIEQIGALTQDMLALVALVEQLAPTIVGEHHRYTGDGCSCQATTDYHHYTLAEWCGHVWELAGGGQQ